MQYDWQARQMPTPCTLCGGTRYRDLHRLSIGNVLSCCGCGLVSLYDHDRARLVTCEYDSSYFAGNNPNRPWGYVDYAGAERSVREATAAAMVDVLSSLGVSAGPVLDVGCGGGYFVAAATQRGWDPQGIDLSTAAPAMSDRLGVKGRVQVASIAAFASKTRRRVFNAVTLFDVIEHLHDPVSAIRDALAVLRPEGLLVVTTPRFGGPLYRKQGERYIQFKKDHVHYFTESTLVRTVESAGAVKWRLLPVHAAMSAAAGKPDAAVVDKYEHDRDTLLLAAVGGT
jgi:2-polyprenyl-3-methyl-5-hydroxy-6-metoxy-1,4-benzoquinol methylase